MLASTAWIWHTSAWITAAAAGLLLLWGFFQNRSRGRKRCPKCWYALDDVPRAPDGWRCPECGRLTTREKRLHRTRRRLWTVVPAALAFLGTYALWATPRAQREGWSGFVPTTVLVYLVHELDAPTVVVSRGFGSFPLLQSTPPPAPTLTRHERLHQSLQDRLYRSELWFWQGRWLAQRLERGSTTRPLGSRQWEQHYRSLIERGVMFSQPRGAVQRAFLRVEIRSQLRLRNEYPVDAPVFVDFGRLHLIGWPENSVLTVLEGGREVLRKDSLGPRIVSRHHAPWNDRWADDVVTLSAGTDGRLIARITERDNQGNEHVYANIRINLPIVRSMGYTGPRSARREGIADGLKYYLAPRINGDQLHLFNSGHPLPNIPTGMQEVLKGERDVTLAVRIEILRDARVIATRSAWWRMEHPAVLGSHLAPTSRHTFALTPEELGALLPGPIPLTLRLTGDPIVALRDMESTHYWEGQIEVPFVP